MSTEYATEWKAAQFSDADGDPGRRAGPGGLPVEGSPGSRAIVAASAREPFLDRSERHPLTDAPGSGPAPSVPARFCC